MTTIAQLIAHLQTLPGDLPVAFELHSEQCLLDLKDLRIAQLCYPRPDGWVHHARPDKPTQPYLLFPGN